MFKSVQDVRDTLYYIKLYDFFINHQESYKQDIVKVTKDMA